MKKYNVVLKNSGQLIMSFITYDKKIEKKILKQFSKLRCYCDIFEVKK